MWLNFEFSLSCQCLGPSESTSEEPMERFFHALFCSSQCRRYVSGLLCQEGKLRCQKANLQVSGHKITNNYRNPGVKQELYGNGEAHQKSSPQCNLGIKPTLRPESEEKFTGVASSFCELSRFKPEPSLDGDYTM